MRIKVPGERKQKKKDDLMGEAGGHVASGFPSPGKTPARHAPSMSAGVRCGDSR